MDCLFTFANCQYQRTVFTFYVELSYNNVFIVHLLRIMAYSVQQRILILKTYWENKNSIETTISKLAEIFGPQGISVPQQAYIVFLESIFMETGSLRDDDNYSDTSDAEGADEEEAEESLESEEEENDDVFLENEDDNESR